LIVKENEVQTLPAKYSKMTTTPLKVTIKDSGNELAGLFVD
jgi:hypothetical protein